MTVDPVQKYTDLTFGLLLVLALVAVYLSDLTDIWVGIGIGIFIGYIVHVGSEMVKFQSVIGEVEDTVEDVGERVENVEQTVETVEDESKRAREVSEETKEQVEETKEQVEANGGDA